MTVPMMVSPKHWVKMVPLLGMSSASRSPTICMVLYRRFRDSTVFSTMAAMGSFPSARAWAATSTQRLVIWP